MSAPRRYVTRCSCGKWEHEGTAVELAPLIRQHDDSPWLRHIVSIFPFGPETDADFQEPRSLRAARHPVSFEVDVAGLCHWRRGLANDVPHHAFHFGSVCPYDVVAAVQAGQPDPRDLVHEWNVDISAALNAKGAVPLSMNDRMHWAAKAKATDRVKSVVRNAVLAASVPHLERLHVEMHYRPKTNRFRDIDNTVATLKPAIDALHTQDRSTNAPVPFEPIIDGDDPRYVTWSPPILHAWQRGAEPALWLVLRSTMISRSVAADLGEQGALL